MVCQCLHGYMDRGSSFSVRDVASCYIEWSRSELYQAGQNLCIEFLSKGDGVISASQRKASSLMPEVQRQDRYRPTRLRGSLHNRLRQTDGSPACLLINRHNLCHRNSLVRFCIGSEASLTSLPKVHIDSHDARFRVRYCGPEHLSCCTKFTKEKKRYGGKNQLSRNK